MTDREKLERANNAFKESIDQEIKEVKRDVNKVGRSALIGGAVALSVLAITSLLGPEDNNSDKKKRKKNKAKKVSGLERNGVLLDTLKKEVLLIGLTFATQKLAEFIKDLKEQEREESN